MHKPTLHQFIKFHQNRLRSVSLEYDLSDSERLKSYFLTAQGGSSLERIINGLESNIRAWTITGPYGSGKSFFGLFLTQLLDKEQPQHLIAMEIVRKSHPDLALLIENLLETKGGLYPVVITGTRASIKNCIIRGFEQAIEKGNFPEELKQSLMKTQSSDNHAFIRWIKNFTETINKNKSFTKGVLLLFDELGIVLEYSAHFPQESDIYLLQELAEYAVHSNSQPFTIIGILHQSFERYATFLDKTTQREWAKINGRFEDIPFHESPIQQMRLISEAFGGEKINSVNDNQSVQHWCPPTISTNEFYDICQKVYPLHSSVFSALPYVFRNLAQNERSIFSYLLSNEPFGLQEFLLTHYQGDYLTLPYLFDYITTNYPSIIYSPNRARQLTETVERLENMPNLKIIEKDVLKTIGMLNWLSETSPFKANKESILNALNVYYDENDLLNTLKSFQLRSIITFRRFNETYSIWKGSDIDLEERIIKARSTFESTLNIAEFLQDLLPPRPIFAHRHNYITGSQRFFDVHYVDIHNRDAISLTPSKNAVGIILICLPSSQSEANTFVQWAKMGSIANYKNIIVGIAKHSVQLFELIKELQAMHWVSENTPELKDDPIARREWRSRYTIIKEMINNELGKAFNLQQISIKANYEWFYCGKNISHNVKRGISIFLSDICDRLYPASPILKNELLNRHELSSQGAAARRILIEGILTRSDQELLGINKYPPERSMYESLLGYGNLHKQVGNRWAIIPPDSNNPLNLYPCWQAINDFIFGEIPKPRPVSDLYNILFSPPFGITAGLAPVLLALFYKIHENEITLYKEGTLIVKPEVADWELLLRRPELFSIAGARVTGLRAAIIERMANSLQTPPYVLPIVQSLFTRIKSLPYHAFRTQKLPDIAIKLRRTFETARSPEHFIFVELPEALDLPPLDSGKLDQAVFDTFFERLNNALEALANVTPRLISWARDLWLTSCGLPIGEKGWIIFLMESRDMSRRVNHPQLIPLLKRTVEINDYSSLLESLLALIANKPPRSWNDTDAERFAAQAEYLGKIWQSESSVQYQLKFSEEKMMQIQNIAQKIELQLKKLDVDKEVLQDALQWLLIQMKQS